MPKNISVKGGKGSFQTNDTDWSSSTTTWSSSSTTWGGFFDISDVGPTNSRVVDIKPKIEGVSDV